MLPSLPSGYEVEIEVRILSPSGEVIGQGVVQLDKAVESVSEFRAVGLAVQAGVYEALRAVWPKEIDRERKD